MDNIELQNLWNVNNDKLDQILTINKELALDLSKQKLNQQIKKLYRPKSIALLIGIPYTLLIFAIALIAFQAEAYLVFFGFGAIGLIMTILLSFYSYQMYLVGLVRKEDNVLEVQQQLSKLHTSSFNSLNLSIFQLPFWSVCWMSISAFKESPLVYGGINLLIFLLLSILSYWIFKKVSYKNKESKIRDFFMSGNEWEPILKSSEILEQIKEFER